MRLVDVDPTTLKDRKRYFGWYCAVRGPNFAYYVFPGKLDNGTLHITPGKKSYLIRGTIRKGDTVINIRKSAVSFREGYILLKSLLKEYRWDS